MKETNSRFEHEVEGLDATYSDDAADREMAYVNGEVARATTDTLQLFLNEISRHPLLSASEEIELARRAEQGDRKAHDELITSNLALVVATASRYRQTELALLDLIQEGVIGLIQAVDRFDWRRGHKFSTYATWWIRHAVQRAIANKARTIRIPVSIADQARKLAAVEAKLETKLGRSPTDAEIARSADIPLARVRHVREVPRTVASLDQPLSAEDETSLAALIPGTHREPGEEVVISLYRAALRRALRRAFSALPERERSIIEFRYAINEGEPLTQAEIGRRLGLTRERIRQIETSALERLARERELQALREAA